MFWDWNFKIKKYLKYLINLLYSKKVLWALCGIDPTPQNLTTCALGSAYKVYPQKRTTKQVFAINNIYHCKKKFMLKINQIFLFSLN